MPAPRLSRALGRGHLVCHLGVKLVVGPSAEDLGETLLDDVAD